jgi:fructokinase
VPTTQAVITLDKELPSYVFHRDGTAERCVSAQSIAAAMPEGATHFHAGSLFFAGG